MRRMWTVVAFGLILGLGLASAVQAAAEDAATQLTAILNQTERPTP